MFGGVVKLIGLAVGAVIVGNVSSAITLASLPHHGYDLVRIENGKVRERIPVVQTGYPKPFGRHATAIMAQSTWVGLKFNHAMPDGSQVTCNFIATLVRCDDPWVIDKKAPKPGSKPVNMLFPG